MVAPPIAGITPPCAGAAAGCVAVVAGAAVGWRSWAICEAHGGTVQALSVGRRRGCTFVITLPAGAQ